MFLFWPEPESKCLGDFDFQQLLSEAVEPPGHLPSHQWDFELFFLLWFLSQSRKSGL